MTSRPPIGAMLREAMVRKGLKQHELAAAVGVSRSAVNAWVNDRAWPQDYQIAALEEALEIRLPRWWESDPPAAPPPAGTVERELYDLVSIDKGPGVAWQMVEELRRRKRRIA